MLVAHTYTACVHVYNLYVHFGGNRDQSSVLRTLFVDIFILCILRVNTLGM